MEPDLQTTFPASYRSARRAFITACQKRGVDVISRVNPKAKGPDGAPLFLDVAATGERNADRALVLLSGVHGVDGYFGSGVQTGLMRMGITPPKGVKLVMIHAVNPFGFAWHRWENEDNVDINCNFPADFTHPPANPDDPGLTGTTLHTHIRRHGEHAVWQTIQGGQYDDPGGLFFGGRAESWSARALAAICTEDLVKARTVTAIPLQTGAGRAGSATMQGGRETPVHLPAANTLGAGLARWLAPAKLTFDALSVGTVPLAAMLQVLLQANRHDRSARVGAQAPEIAQAMRDTFFVDTPEWKKRAWDHARRRVTAGLAALA